ATCVRVPVFVSHSEAVNIEFENPISADEARNILRSAPGCLVIDKRETGGYVTPYEAAGEDATYISRIREDATVENGLELWCVSVHVGFGNVIDKLAGVARAERIGRDAFDRHVDRAASLERGMQGTRTIGLDTDDLHATRKPCGNPGDQSAATDRHQHGIEVG